MRAAIAALISATTVLAQPEQVHLSLTADPTAIAVDFVAPADAAGVTAAYGNPAKNAAVDCVTQTLNTYKAQFCTAVFGPGLAANTVYSYTLPAGGKAFTTNFTNQPARDPIYAVYADFGLEADYSLKSLIADSEAGGFDYVIHAGDWGAWSLARPGAEPPLLPRLPSRPQYPPEPPLLARLTSHPRYPLPLPTAYDFDSGNSAVGNSFMNSIQPYAARRPYMGIAGKCVPFSARARLRHPLVEPAPHPACPLTLCAPQPRGLRHAGRRGVCAVCAAQPRAGAERGQELWLWHQSVVLL